MKAERDDTPHQVRKKLSSRWRFLTILGVGSAAFWTVVFLFAKPITIDVEQLKKAIQVDNQDAARQQRLENEKAQALARLMASPDTNTARQPIAEIHAYRPAPPPAEPQPKQTVFNDQNYRPRTDINTMEGMKLGVVNHSQNQPITAPITPKTRKTDSWQWESTAGLLSWDEIDGKIDFNTVCAEEKYGSFRYRDCRKAAKETFKRRCGRGDEASCHAVNHYRPLG